MSTIVMFSRYEHTLEDIRNRLAGMGFSTHWIAIEAWYCNREAIRQAAGVILDKADEDFRWLDPVDDLELWLLTEDDVPPRLFLLSDNDNHLNSHARSDPRTKVHHLSAELSDDEIYSFLHSHRHEYADEVLVAI